MRNGRYYIGSTTDLERRMKEHDRGIVYSTRNNRPLSLLYSREYKNIEKAREIEMRLKKWKSRVKIKEFMDGKVI